MAAPSLKKFILFDNHLYLIPGILLAFIERMTFFVSHKQYKVITIMPVFNHFNLTRRRK